MTQKQGGGEFMSMTEGAMMWTVEEVAAALNISKRTIWRMESCGELPPAIRMGRVVRWSAQEIRGWIARKQEESRRKKEKLPQRA